MRTHILLIFAAALALAGCGPSTPLGHALAALKAGDRDAFLKAKAEAAAALDTGWQPASDACRATAADFEMHGEAALIDKLDHADLFKLPDEQRFIYAAHIAGKWAVPMSEGWAWAQSAGIAEDPTFKNGHTSDCDQQTAMQKMIFYGQAPSEVERIAIMKDWQDELQSRYGDAVRYDRAMREADAALDRNGFTAEYPLTLELTDPEDGPPVTTFADVQKKLDGR